VRIDRTAERRDDADAGRRLAEARSDQRETLELYLRDRDAAGGGDWRTWNWSRHRAEAALDDVP
jgi:hypothetical protein